MKLIEETWKTGTAYEVLLVADKAPAALPASGKDVAQGAAIYLVADGKLTTAATTTSGSDATNNLRVGVCWEPAASTAAVVSVKINV